MDIGKAITFFTEDEHWVRKVSIGTGVVLISMMLMPVLFIGLLGFFILGGYSIRLLQNVRDGQPQPLPDWDDWGGDMARGFKYVVVAMVWSLAAYLMMVPMAIGGALTDSGGAGEFIGSAILICTSCLLILYGIFVALIAPGFTISFAHDERIGSGLKVTKIWQWTKANLGQVIIVMLVVMAVSFIVSMLAGILGLILCVIGMLVTIPFSMLFLSMFQYNLYGQLAREHPMYDSPSAVPAPMPPAAPTTTEPDTSTDIVAGTDVAGTGAGVVAAADESTVIVPPAPMTDDSGDASTADDATYAPPAAVTEVTDVVDETVEITSTEAASTDEGDDVTVIASEVSESSEEISDSVDDIVEASTDVVEDTTDDAGTAANPGAADDDSTQKADA
jgi:hypothetical protein